MNDTLHHKIFAKYVDNIILFCDVGEDYDDNFLRKLEEHIDKFHDLPIHAFDSMFRKLFYRSITSRVHEITKSNITVSVSSIQRCIDNGTLTSSDVHDAVRQGIDAYIQEFVFEHNKKLINTWNVYREPAKEEKPFRFRERPVSYTSNPQYEKLKNDRTMEAFRDRTVKVDVPFLENWKRNG